MEEGPPEADPDKDDMEEDDVEAMVKARTGASIMWFRDKFQKMVQVCVWVEGRGGVGRRLDKGG